MSILVTGGKGMVGHAFEKYDVIRVGSSDYDLRSLEQCLAMIEDHQVDQIIHLAAKVGGVKGNIDFVGEYFRDNLLINTNVLEAARLKGVKKVLSLLSTCIYPDEISYPLSEEKIHLGPPHPSNFGYAYAKRMLHIQSLAYREQWGCNYIVAVPNNLYGEHDNFENVYSHVIPSIIRKMYESKIRHDDQVVLWGDGSPLREFTYSQDIAEILLMLLKDYHDPEPINIGNTSEISIKELSELIANKIGFKGQIVWDANMPKGQFRKPSTNAKFEKLFHNFKYTEIEVGVEKTCQWFEKAYPNIRGI